MPRFLLPDLLRTVAIVLMVIYHIAFDLVVLWGISLPILTGGWWLLARSAAALFLFTSGLTDAIPRKQKRTWRRFFILAGCAALVTLTTMPIGSDFIKFGILHLMALSVLLLLPFRKLPDAMNAAIGIVIIVVGTKMGSPITYNPLLFPLGFITQTFSSLDYFPVLPWFGWILLGRSAATPLFDAFPKTYTQNQKEYAFLLLPGRRSLLIYLIHQPILLAILAMILGNPRGFISF